MLIYRMFVLVELLMLSTPSLNFYNREPLSMSAGPKVQSWQLLLSEEFQGFPSGRGVANTWVNWGLLMQNLSYFPGAQSTLLAASRLLEPALQLPGDARDLRVGAVVRLQSGEGWGRGAEWHPVLPEAPSAFLSVILVVSADSLNNSILMCG